MIGLSALLGSFKGSCGKSQPTSKSEPTSMETPSVVKENSEAEIS